MKKEVLEQNIKEIIAFYNNINSWLNNILIWVKENTEEREVLNDFLFYIWIESNEETRLCAYFRLIWLNESSLSLYLDNNNFSKEKKDEILDLSYEYVVDFHSEIFLETIKFIEDNNLLTSFYLEIFKWTHLVWNAFNKFFLPWRNHIVNWINRDLENKFENNSDKIISYLNENNLFDLWHNWEIADRSYSTLVLEDDKYISKSYKDVFSYEVWEIINALNIFIENLNNLNDDLYDSKNQYISYLTSIKNAFNETNVNLLVEKWSIVDNEWMKIKTPFQIAHPLEFYEDKYRKAVAPEWDLRLQNKVFDSKVEKDILNMYEEIFDDIGRDKYESSYNFSLANQKRVQLYLTSPVLYYSSELTWLFSAQVVPNDEIISDKYWKKIFAFPEMVLENKRSNPFMKLASTIFDENLLDEYRKYLFSDSKNFYKIYDIETIWHEYGHTLWLDINSESIMNNKTWVFKNIEEFKATTWWLVAYFMWDNNDLQLSRKLIVDHVMRSIGLIAYKKVNEVEPYYCEALIHLDILFQTWIINLNSENKIEISFDESIYELLKSNYISHYKKLINVYLEKKDAMVFLSDYTIKDWLHFLPKNENIKNFVNYYYETYEKIWNVVDDKISKDKYKKEA